MKQEHPTAWERGQKVGNAVGTVLGGLLTLGLLSKMTPEQRWEYAQQQEHYELQERVRRLESASVSPSREAPPREASRSTVAAGSAESRSPIEEVDDFFREWRAERTGEAGVYDATVDDQGGNADARAISPAGQGTSGPADGWVLVTPPGELLDDAAAAALVTSVQQGGFFEDYYHPPAFERDTWVVRRAYDTAADCEAERQRAIGIWSAREKALRGLDYKMTLGVAYEPESVEEASLLEGPGLIESNREHQAFFHGRCVPATHIYPRSGRAQSAGRA